MNVFYAYLSIWLFMYNINPGSLRLDYLPLRLYLCFLLSACRPFRERKCEHQCRGGRNISTEAFMELGTVHTVPRSTNDDIFMPSPQSEGGKAASRPRAKRSTRDRDDSQH